ncbi:MAG: phytanoyl-CoA dioxygenase family protein [Gammaproteobacteria bacterium]|nr:phytanoyl-CoA dioxygenase family protein [Gammaproteobacteria bacterium]NIW50335.1 phytanoyl-CoA dioxygenase family protein [Gammaproteobacteria bacterium]NIX59726.1 phytanoyl-CoA dioxygenase family protein [candidate division Zixibacteria bacterium]
MNIFNSNKLEGLKQKFDEEGYVVIRNVIDAELVQQSRDHINWLLENHPDTRPEQLHHTLMVDDPFWVRLVKEERLLDIAEQFIGPNIALFASHYISKPPRDGQAVLWHQDGSYWPLKPMKVITLWLAIDESTPENGCMRVIPRTQDMDLQELQERHDVPNVLASGIDESLVDQAEAVDLILKPGDVSIHHPNVIHGSNANNSDKWRRALTIRYIPTTTRVTDETWPSVFLLRGEAVPGINDYRPYPRYVECKHFRFRGSENWPPEN